MAQSRHVVNVQLICSRLIKTFHYYLLPIIKETDYYTSSELRFVPTYYLHHHHHVVVCWRYILWIFNFWVQLWTKKYVLFYVDLIKRRSTIINCTYYNCYFWTTTKNHMPLQFAAFLKNKNATQRKKRFYFF